MKYRMTERQYLAHQKRIKQLSDGEVKALAKATKVPQCSVIPPVEPQIILWQALVRIYGRVDNGGEIAWEQRNAIPGRRYRIDIAIPQHKISIECNGYRHHGLSKDGFKRDHQKQNLLVINGWTPLIFYAQQIKEELNGCLETIKLTIELKKQHSTNN